MKKNYVLPFIYNLRKRIFSKNSLGFAEYILVSSLPSQLKAACEHLKYWPYVKAFYPIDNMHIKVIIYIGNHIQEDKWEHYLIQSLQLMNKCVNQYGCIFIYKNANCKSFKLKYKADAFIRPDNMLRSFAYFIDDIENLPF